MIDEMLTGGIRHDEMRRRNRSLVIAAIRRIDRPSRTEIAGLTGLSQSTISAIASDLIAEGIMLETEHGTNATLSRRGRPQVALALNPDAACAVCIHLSFNQLAATVVDYSGTTIESRSQRLNTLTLSRQALIDAVIQTIQDVTEQHGRFMRIVFAIQGVTDAAGKEMLWSPIILHSHIPFGRLLEETFCVPVSVHNDCNLITTALHWKNPERYDKNFVAVLLSHGIGMGLMLNGRIFTGIRSSGGEFGHMTHKPDGSLCRCGRRGCIEAYAGTYAIKRRAQGEYALNESLTDMHDTNTDLAALLTKARAGDELTRQAFREAGEAIGFGLSNLFSLIDPVPVAMIGPGTSAFDILEPEIRAAIGETAAGQNAQDISFEVWPDDTPLIQQGCAMEALNSVDHEISAPGLRTEGRSNHDSIHALSRISA